MVLMMQGLVNSMGLKFDTEKLKKEILSVLQIELETALNQWEEEVKKNLRSDKFKSNATVSHQIMKEGKSILAYLKANAYTLADTYGTGSLMSDDNPWLAEYKAGDYWNDQRKGKEIVGRKEGHYTDIFGNEHYSQGKLAGDPLEGHHTSSGELIEAVAPSKALDIAEEWLYNQWLPQAYSRTVQKVNFADFLIETK